MSFTSLGLSAELLRAIAEQGYDKPTPIQAQAIPAVLAGRDLMASAQTGTGKTAAFTLPLLHRLSAPAPRKGRVRALVLVPTRELAAQVADAVRTYGRHLRLRCAQVYGGVKMGPQFRELRAGVDVLVATPGRLIDHLERRSADLSGVEVLVLDEADRMLDMGFLPAIERILAQVPASRQTLLFSATFSDSIRRLAQRFQREPERIEVARRNAAADAVNQSAYLVDHARKRELLVHLFEAETWQQVLVFTRTKAGADRLAKQLDKDGIEATAIHGDKSQHQRMRALSDFKRMKVRALVATDVAARGIDIDALPHVVNFDLPHNPEDYVHRIGRTGRAGQKGAAISLVANEERSLFAAIKRLVKLDIAAATVAGFEPQQRAPAPHRPHAHRKGSAPRPHPGHGGQRHGAGRHEHRDHPGRSAQGHGKSAAKTEGRHRRPETNRDRSRRDRASLG